MNVVKVTPAITTRTHYSGGGGDETWVGLEPQKVSLGQVW